MSLLRWNRPSTRCRADKDGQMFFKTPSDALLAAVEFRRKHVYMPEVRCARLRAGQMSFVHACGRDQHMKLVRACSQPHERSWSLR
jgi:hypothetical protein